jgi:predicted esterase YcpF (UPF0227 family)
MLVYLHGLNSSNQSYKAGVLRERLAPVPVLCPAYPAHRPDLAVATLSGFLRDLQDQGPPVVVGSSMGAFYGQHLARRFRVAHLFMINPALRPWDLLHEYEGATQSTADGQEYVIDRALIESTRRYGVPDPCAGVPTTLFLDKGDEVIDYRVAESLYRGCGRLLLFEGGDHGFQHLDEAIGIIREAVAGRGRGD